MVVYYFLPVSSLKKLSHYNGTLFPVKVTQLEVNKKVFSQ